MSTYECLLERLEECMGTGTTTTDELDYVGKRLFNIQWRGAVAKDRIPKLKKGDVSIVNTHASHDPGEHWVALARCEDGEILGYDSFGRPLFDIGETNAELDPEQRIEEDNCGQRCLAWLLVLKKYGKACALSI